MSPRLESEEVTIPARVVRVTHEGRPYDTLIVAKITFDLRPGTCPVAAVQEAMVLEGGTYGPLSNSLRRIQDIAPQKPRSEVLVVGSAFAPGGVHDKAFEVRVQVSTVDKVILVRPPRFLERDGTVTMEAGPQATQLSYELSRGDETWNPFGVDDAAPDESGRIPLPRIELPSESDSVSGPVGLGPIPLFSDWSVRSLGKTPDGVVELLWDGETSTLNAAPEDQQLGRAIPEGVTVNLTNLHPSHARFSSKLEWVRPVAHVPGAGSTALIADTLLIDTDLGVCLVTYRASLGRAHVDTWVAPRIELVRAVPGRALVPQTTAQFDAFDLAEHTVDTPFAPARRLPGEDTVQLARRDLEPAHVGKGDTLPPPPGLPGDTPEPRESIATTRDEPRPSHAFERPTYIAKGENPVPPPRQSMPTTGDGPSTAPKNALQASNDALVVEARTSSDTSSKLKLVPRVMSVPRDAPETIELLWFAPDVIPRLRTAPALADAFPENMQTERGVTNPADFTRDVRRALLFAKPALAPQSEIAISESDRKSGLYRTPLLLVVGEIAAAFDAKLALEATIGAIEMLLPNEKTTKPLVGAAKKLLDTEWITTPPLDQAALNLREATTKLRDPNAALVEPTVERLLLEKRAYRTRLVFGGEHLRFTWYDEGRPGVPIYVPTELKDRLPMYPKVRARALVEVRPRQDAFESHAAALLLRAIGRRLDP